MAHMLVHPNDNDDDNEDNSSFAPMTVIYTYICTNDIKIRYKISKYQPRYCYIIKTCHAVDKFSPARAIKFFFCCKTNNIRVTDVKHHYFNRKKDKKCHFSFIFFSSKLIIFDINSMYTISFTTKKI